MKKKIIWKVFALVMAVLLAIPTVSVPVNAKKVPSMNVSSVKLQKAGSTKKLKVVNLPNQAKVSWKVKKPKVISITPKKKTGVAVVTGLKKGTGTVVCTVTTKKGVVYTMSTKVTVGSTKVPATAVTITNAQIDKTYNAHLFTEGDTFTFKAELTSSDAAKPSTDKVYWVVEDTKIAKVSSSGKVTALSEGTTELTVYAGATKEKALASNVKETIRLHVDAAEVKVQEVKLEHGKKVAITFNKAMDETTLYNATTKELLNSAVVITAEKVDGISAKNPGALKASMSEDQKTLYIESENVFEGTYSVSVSDRVKSKAGAAITSYYEKVVLKDTVAPVVSRVKVDETGTTCQICFSEPVDISNLIVKDPKKQDNGVIFSDTTIFTKASNYKQSEDKMVVSIDLSALVTQDLNCVINVAMYNIYDYVNNAAKDGKNTAYITVPLYTDTTNKKEAVCKSLVRNGNSLVATFDQSIVSAGIATIGDKTLTGKVNPDNKKEVIYDLSSTGLTSTKGIVSVSLFEYSVYAQGAPANKYTANVNFDAAAKATLISGSEFVTKDVNGVKSKVLTLTFTNSVKPVASAGSISATETLDGTVGQAKNYNYSVTANKNKLEFILSGSFTEGATYNFTIPAGFFTDVYNNPNAALSVSTKKTQGDVEALPAPAMIQLDSETKSKVYVIFNTMVDITTAETIANYTINGATITKATVLANDNTYHTPAVVELQLASALTDLDISYQVKISGIKGYRNEYTAMADYNQQINLGSNQTFAYTLSTSVSDNQLILNFASDVNASGSNISVAFDGTKKFKVKGNPVVSGKTIIFTFEDVISKGYSITIYPLVDNRIVNNNNQAMLNLPVTVTVQ